MEEQVINIIKSPKGVNDILPKEHDYFTFIKKVVRHRSRQAGFRRISTAMFEDTSLFERAIGEDTDVVEKELYKISAKDSDKNYSLRPELTAGVVRSYIEHGMGSWPQPVMLYYVDPVFRHDRPQKNRYRQFHQFGLEVIGESDPGVEAQIIHLGWQILKDLKIEKGVSVRINTLGSGKEKVKFEIGLKNYFEGRKVSLCEKCKKRLETSALRILDCKEEDCKLLALQSPKIDSFISKSDKQYFLELKDLLKAVEIPFEEDFTLVRGLDYYNGVIFEFIDKDDKSSQSTLIGGGRYDTLVEKIGGEPTSAAGLGMGIERIINKMKDNNLRIKSKDKIDVFIAQLGHEAKIKCFPIIEKLQNLGISTMGGIGKPSIKGQMRMADKSGAKLCLIMGVIEVRDENIIFRNMEEGRQELVSFKDTVKKVIEFVGKENITEDIFLNDVFYDETPDEEEIEEKSKRAIRKF